MEVLIQGAPEHPRACALRPGWTYLKESSCLHHKGAGAADPFRTGFGKTHDPGEQKTTERRERQKSEKQASYTWAMSSESPGMPLPAFLCR